MSGKSNAKSRMAWDGLILEISAVKMVRSQKYDQIYPTWDPPLQKSSNMAKIDLTQFFCKIWTLAMILVWSSPNLVGWSFFGRSRKLTASPPFWP